MSKLITILKLMIGLLPAPLKRKLYSMNSLRGWYRKMLNQYYFHSYDFDSASRLKLYKEWLQKEDVSDQRYDDTDYPNWVVVINCREANENSIRATLCSIDFHASQAKPRVYLLGDKCFSQELFLKLRSCAYSGVEFFQSVESLVSFFGVDGSECWVSYFVSGDIVRSNWLRYTLGSLSDESMIRLIYTDHDYYSASHDRLSPSFKPDWNLDLLLTTNYIGRSACWKLSPDELQDIFSSSPSDVVRLLWESLLKLTSEAAESELVLHVPKIGMSKPKHELVVHEEQRVFHEAVKAYLPARAISHFLWNSKAVSRIFWSLPDPVPLVSIIIPTRNAKDLVKNCLDSLVTTTDYPSFEVLLVDNQSDDPDAISYFNELKLQNRVRVIPYNKPFNYSAINNFAVEEARGEVIALLNNDVEVINKDWLSEMVSQAMRPGVGCVGAKLLFPDNTIQHGGVVIGYGGVAGHAHKFFPHDHPGYMHRLEAVHNVSAVTAACLVVRKHIYEDVGGLNEVDLTVAFNDVDFCLRVQEAGYRNVFTPHACLYHHESVSRGSDQSGEKYERFQSEIAYMKKRWKTDVIPDPAYNPNLTLSREDFSLKVAHNLSTSLSEK